MTEIAFRQEIVSPNARLIESQSAIAGFVVAVCLCKAFDRLFP